MQNSKLFRLINVLEAKELVEFKQFLSSSFINCGKNEHKLFDIILKSYISKGIEEVNKLSKEELKVQLFPDKEKKKQDSSIRKCMSELAKGIEEYIVHIEINQQLFEKRHLLYDALIRRKEHKEAEQLLKSMNKNPYSEIDIYYFYDDYKTAHKAHEFYSNIYNRFDKQTLQKVSDKFDTYFIINKLQMLCTTLNKKKILGSAEKLQWIPEILTHIETDIIFKNPLIHLFYTCYLLLDNNNKKYFIELSELLKKYDGQISKHGINYFYTILLNHCNAQIRKGNNDYINKSFDLYEQMLLIDLPLGTPQLWQHHFKNIVTLASRLRKFDWALQFIQDYKHKLPKETQEDMVNYNKGIICFYKGDYKGSMDTFHKINTIDFLYHINKEMRLIKAYYELNQLKAIEYTIDSFRTYIRRNGGNRKRDYINFINVVKRLYSLGLAINRLSKLNPKTERLENRLNRIKKDVQDLKPLVDKDWLLEKIEAAKHKIERYKKRLNKIS